jgi:hypothetical protein
LILQNIRPQKSKPKVINQLLLTAQGRLSWLRDKVYTHWNPDYSSSSSSSSSTSATKNSTLSLSMQQQQQQRMLAKNTIQMDVRWWIWNTLFALAPAILIGLYCEFRGKYIVYEFHQQKELENMKRLLGEDYVNEHAQELRLPPPENLVSRMKRLLRDCQEGISVLYGRMGAPVAAEEKVQAPLQALSTPENGKQKSLQAPSKPELDPKLHPSGNSSPKGNASVPLDSEATIQTLLGRIQKLEQTIENQQSQSPQQQAHNTNREPQMVYEKERMNQSDIQNRVEDDLVRKWKQRVCEKQQDTTKTLSAGATNALDDERQLSQPTDKQGVEVHESPIHAYLSKWRKLLGKGNTWAEQQIILSQQGPAANVLLSTKQGTRNVSDTLTNDSESLQEDQPASNWWRFW